MFYYRLMMRSGRKQNKEPVPWFCSSCTAHNAADADRCSNLRCNLMRKVSGVDLIPGCERPFAVPIVSCEKQKRCGECDGCKAPECGLCGMCLDMPKRGGKGTKKQPCELRVCVRVRKGAEERLEERAEEQEAERKRRELERANESAAVESWFSGVKLMLECGASSSGASSVPRSPTTK